MEADVCQFEIDASMKKAIDFELKKFNFERDPVRGLALALETYQRYFLFDFQFGGGGKKESVGEMTSSFDYHAPVGLPAKVG